MNPLLKMFDDELKEIAKMIAEHQGYRPTDKVEEVSHEEVSEGKTQESKGKEEQEKVCSEGEQTSG